MIHKQEKECVSLEVIVSVYVAKVGVSLLAGLVLVVYDDCQLKIPDP